MPVLDRFWWLRLFRAAIFAIFALVAGDVLWGMLTDPSIRSAGGIAGAAFVLLVFAGYAAYMVAESLTARRRKRLRLAVLRGEPVDLLPPPYGVALGPKATLTAVPALPLRLLWRERWYLRIARGLSVAYSVVMLYGLLTVVTGRRVIPLPTPAGFPQVQLSPLFTALVALAATIVVFTLAGRPYGVIADEEGLREQRRWAPSRRIRWSEARLFEARPAKPDEHDLYELSSGKSVYVYAVTCPERYVTWHWPRSRFETVAEPTGSDTSTDGVRLTALIEARTGLQPQALSAS